MRSYTHYRQLINALQSHWVWVPDWVDSSKHNTAGQIVEFSRAFALHTIPTKAVIHFSADTRYKLFVNGRRVAVGPARSSPGIWYYDTLDIARFLEVGINNVRFLVIRYFAASRSGMPFMRTAFPGLTVIGGVEKDGPGSTSVDLSTGDQWVAKADESIKFPTGLIDDVFLHVSCSHSDQIRR